VLWKIQSVTSTNFDYHMLFDIALSLCGNICFFAHWLIQFRCHATHPIEPKIITRNKANRAVVGGALLLGASVWINGTFPERGPYCGGWKIIDDDKQRRQKESDGAEARCWNVNRKTFGSFAVMYHSSMFEDMFNWLANKEQPRPFDHIFPDMIKYGHPVRVADPPLVIQDVRHQSTIDATRRQQHNFLERARIHRWGNIDEYCDAETEMPLALNS
jgi:hypothetical protein